MVCSCHSGLPYLECCSPYHKGKMIPESALILMRSRYSAYALSLPEYIIETTHKDGPSFHSNHEKWKESILFFSKKTDFHDLKIIEFQDGEDASFTENSRFFKVGDKWLYYSGEVEKYPKSIS